MAGAETGMQQACPTCGETVFLHGMIPILGEDGTGIRYVCGPCARKLIDLSQTKAADAHGPVPEG